MKKISIFSASLDHHSGSLPPKYTPIWPILDENCQNNRKRVIFLEANHISRDVQTAVISLVAAIFDDLFQKNFRRPSSIIFSLYPDFPHLSEVPHSMG